MAKQINTRIQLKHDSLTNWNESSIVLKPGEVGVAYVDVATTDAKGNIIHVPTALLKVGENVENSIKTFKELPFMSAIAADVYAWAKKSGIEVVDEGEGEVLSDVTWENDKLVLHRIDVITPAELTTALGSYYTKDEIDGKIEEINQAITDLDVSALEGRVDAVETAVETTLPGQISAVDAKFANYTTTTAQQAIDAEQDRRLGVIEGDYVKAADIADFETKENVKQVADDLAGYQTSNDKALAAVRATADAAAVKTEVETALADRYTKAEADAAFDAKGDAAQALTDAKGYTDTQIQAIMGGEVDEAYNSFLEIQNFLKADETATAQLVEKVNANEAAAAAAQAKADAALPTATAEADYLKKADAATSYEPIGAQSKAEATAKSYTDAEIAKLSDVYDAKGAAADAQAAAIADAAEKYETKGTAQGIVDGLKLAETYEPIGAESRAIAAAKTETENQIAALGIGDYAKTADVEATYATKAEVEALTTDDIEGGIETWIFNCGTASTVI